jgi:fused signal recognition particle receptor
MPVSDYLHSLQQYLNELGLLNEAPLLYFALLVSLFALLLTIRGQRRNREQLLVLTDAVKRLSVSSAEQSDAPATTTGSSVEQSTQVKKKPDSLAPSASADVSSGLAKTRNQFFSRLTELFSGRSALDSESFEQLEELLVSSDLGVGTARMLLQRVKERIKTEKELSASDVRELLKNSVREIVRNDGKVEIDPAKRNGQPLVLLVVGVNGVGKTTTIGKLAAQFKKNNAKVLIAACDTFRAAAVQQMQVWGKRVDVPVEAGEEGAKPSTVAYIAAKRAVEEDFDVLIVDTAGRLHTRVNLMNELVSVTKILDREIPGAPHETLLVLDASTGQNALQQAREFNEKTELSGIAVTKLDGTPKGGIVVAIREELGIPIRYIGVGEGVEDLKVFDSDAFVQALFQDGEAGGSASSSVRKVSRKRSRERAVS